MAGIVQWVSREGAWTNNYTILLLYLFFESLKKIRKKKKKMQPSFSISLLSLFILHQKTLQHFQEKYPPHDTHKCPFANSTPIPYFFFALFLASFLDDGCLAI